MSDPQTDPLDALRMPAQPVDPDPGFAARLRARLQRALDEPTGGTAMTSAASATITPAEELPLRTLTPYIGVDDARRALEFYVRAFGARRRGDPIVMDDGRIGHAELALGDSVLMLADEFAEIGLMGPKRRGGPSQTLLLQVADVDTTVAQAVAAGAELTRPVADSPHGRNGVVVDPFGHRWMISTAPAPPSPHPDPDRPTHPQGRVGYLALWTPDVERAAGFFTAVLGWSYSDSEPQHRMVEGAVPPHGIVALSALPAGVWDRWPRHSTLFLSHAVDNVDAAVARVRAAGGQSAEPTEEPYGRSAHCVDDQGMPFAVHEDSGPPPAAPPGPAQAAYLTFEVADSARARDFFGSVFGWRFTPGRVPDGWQIDGGLRGGFHGGHEQPTIVPMYAVDDIDTAVTRVRDAGGTATDPQRQPYGTTSTCTDDQGTHFYLGELG